jgi:hypothetical protein
MFTSQFRIPDAFHMAGSPEADKDQEGRVYRHENTMGDAFDRAYTIAFNTSGPFARIDVQTTREGIESLRDALNVVLVTEDAA